MLVSRFSLSPLFSQNIFESSPRPVKCTKSFNSKLACHMGNERERLFAFEHKNDRYYIDGAEKTSTLSAYSLMFFNPVVIINSLYIEIALLLLMVMSANPHRPILFFTLVSASLYCWLFRYYGSDLQNLVNNGDFTITNLLYCTFLINLLCITYILFRSHSSLVVGSIRKNIAKYCQILLLIPVIIIWAHTIFFRLWLH